MLTVRSFVCVMLFFLLKLWDIFFVQGICSWLPFQDIWYSQAFHSDNSENEESRFAVKQELPVQW